jgi:PPOX class probable F420-dependent enzyme
MSISLDKASYGLLSTRKKNGSMVDTPVWFASDIDHHYVFSAADAGKIKRLRNFSEIQLAPCTVMGKPLGDTARGNAVLITDPDHIQYAHQQLTKKYGWQMRILDFLSRLSGKYHHRAFIKITLKSINP